MSVLLGLTPERNLQEQKGIPDMKAALRRGEYEAEAGFPKVEGEQGISSPKEQPRATNDVSTH